MAYDEELAERIRERLDTEEGISERRMFGGLAFCVDGRMAVAVSGRGALMVRLPDDEVDAALDRPHVEPMVMRDRPVRGWVLVLPEGLEGSSLASWVEKGLGHARGLEPS